MKTLPQAVAHGEPYANFNIGTKSPRVFRCLYKNCNHLNYYGKYCHIHHRQMYREIHVQKYRRMQELVRMKKINVCRESYKVYKIMYYIFYSIIKIE